MSTTQRAAAHAERIRDAAQAGARVDAHITRMRQLPKAERQQLADEGCRHVATLLIRWQALRLLLSEDVTR